MKVFIKNRNGLKMAINLNINRDNNKLVFLLHGLSSRKEYPHMQVLENEFAYHGYNVVNIDATNSLNESESSKEGFTFTGHYSDLEDVVVWARTQEFYKEPFALAGQSLGAAAIINYAINFSDKVNLLVPVSLPWIIGREYSKTNRRREEILINGFYDQVSRSSGRTLRIGKNYLDDLENYDFTLKAKKIKAPTYLIVGSLDNEKYIEDNKQLLNLLTCNNKQLFVLQDVPHDVANTEEHKQLFSSTLKEILNKVN